MAGKGSSKTIDSLGSRVLARDTAVSLNSSGVPSGALAGSKTPTQELPNPGLAMASMSTGSAAPDNKQLDGVAGQVIDPISKRRGSDTLSIGIPPGAASRQRPFLGASSAANGTSGGTSLSNEATPIASPQVDKSSPGSSAITAKPSIGQLSTRPPIARQVARANTKTSGDGKTTDDEAGYDGEREPETEIEQSPVSANRSNDSFTNVPDFPSSTASSNATHIPQSGSLPSANAKTSSQPNGQNHFDRDGRSHLPHKRNHTRSSTVDSIGSTSSKRDPKDNMKPFPTPGIKEERNPFEEEKSVEEGRLDEAESKAKHWKRWGPYLSERQWATVREDYSGNGDAWTHFPHDHARSRAYRWGEDGLAGLSDNHQRLCFGLALWNGVDPILKERLFGVTGHQGNHGEDVKEMYYYLDSTPTHSYMKYLYKYPQREYPYEQLVRESTQRSRDVVEFEITDTDAFDDDRYWDIFVEYAKDEQNENGCSIRITAYNRGPEPADLHIIPQLWFRNTWSWPKERPTGKKMPSMKAKTETTVQMNHETLGRYFCHFNESPGPIEPVRRGERSRSATQQPVISEESVAPELMFTDNDTNFHRLYGGVNQVPYVKDAFHDHIIFSHRHPLPKSEQPAEGEIAPTADHLEVEPKLAPCADSGSPGKNFEQLNNQDDPPHSLPSTPQPTTKYHLPEVPAPKWPNFINPERKGTKVGANYVFHRVPPRGGCCVVRLKLTDKDEHEDESCYDEEYFDETIQERKYDADEFYSRFNSGALTDDLRNIMRQALAGMLWTKQFYYFIQKEWLAGDPGQPPPPPERQWVRNRDWRHLHCEDILSMPDKWEYPFFAAWDTAFHCIPLAMVDPAYAKNQLMLMTREWYMKPDGALPAYEWNYGDVNPPVHAWATFRVFKIERKMYGREDIGFLERVFQKLLMNFTWWVNRKDAGGLNVFEGGFLGLDNIGIFNRSEPLPTGGTLRQADGTSWMAFYCLNMLNMALELAKHNPSYEDIASKFFEHFVFISDAMTFRSGDHAATSLWNEEDGFYYDAIEFPDGRTEQMPVRSLVGLIPLYGTLTLEPGIIKKFPGFRKRMDWFIQNRGDISNRNIANMAAKGRGDRKLLALASEDRLRKILKRMLNEDEFLSEYGIRSLSKEHKEKPYSMDLNGEHFEVNYWPGDSHSGMFGGNSNWRGPIWLATTFLLIESLQRFHQYYGHDFKIECPTGSGDMMNLANVAEEIQHRIINIFQRDHEGNRAYNGGNEKLNKDVHFREHVQFYEYFHADSAKGIGASHQTGWTGLIAWFIFMSGHTSRMPRTPRTPRSTAAHYFGEYLPTTPAGSSYETDTATEKDFVSAGELSPDEL